MALFWCLRKWKTKQTQWYFSPSYKRSIGHLVIVGSFITAAGIAKSHYFSSIGILLLLWATTLQLYWVVLSLMDKDHISWPPQYISFLWNPLFTSNQPVSCDLYWTCLGSLLGAFFLIWGAAFFSLCVEVEFGVSPRVSLLSSVLPCSCTEGFSLSRAEREGLGSARLDPNQTPVGWRRATQEDRTPMNDTTDSYSRFTNRL